MQEWIGAALLTLSTWLGAGTLIICALLLCLAGGGYTSAVVGDWRLNRALRADLRKRYSPATQDVVDLLNSTISTANIVEYGDEQPNLLAVKGQVTSHPYLYTVHFTYHDCGLTVATISSDVFTDGEKARYLLTRGQSKSLTKLALQRRNELVREKADKALALSSPIG